MAGARATRVPCAEPRIDPVSVESPYATLLAAVPVRERVVHLQHGETRYWDYGPADAETTIVVVHGYRGEHHGLEPVVAHLGGVRIVSPDLPGFGDSPRLASGSHDVAGYAAWLRGFVAAIGLEGRAVVLGHSFGSIVASAAVAGGLPTPRLVLVNPIAAPALDGPNRFMSRLTLLYYRSARALPAAIGSRLLGNRLIVRFMSVLLAESSDPGLRRWIHDQHATYFSRYADRDSLVEGFEASIGTDVSMFAPEIAVPTLLIGADRDPITTVAAQQRLATLFPDARLVIIPGVGHLVHYEKPREAAEAIVAFLGAGRVVVA